MGTLIHADNIKSVLNDPADVVMTEVLCRWVVAINSAVDAASVGVIAWTNQLTLTLTN
jgi:hypothetical protein